jgi:CRP-like cAMP-binding protein
MTLPDILQILVANNRTGTLRITGNNHPASASIYFLNGNPVNATNGPLVGLDAVYSLFGWAEGKFEFHEHKRLVDVEQVIKKSSMEITLSAMKMLDEGKIRRIGSFSFDVRSPSGSDELRNGKEGGITIINGPPIDFMYILEEKKFSDGERIVTEGSWGNWIWVVLEGMVEISRVTPKGSMRIVRLGEGCFIGTLLCLFHRVNQRSATATAIGDVHLGMLDNQRLSGDFTCLSHELKGLLSSFTRRLNKVTEKAINQPKSDQLIKDKTPFIEKECSEKAFIIKKGEAHVMRQAEGGFLPLLTLGKKDVFGHVPFMDIGHEPHCASILGSKDLEAEALDIASIKKEYEQAPATLRSLVQHAVNCIFETTKMVFHQ